MTAGRLSPLAAQRAILITAVAVSAAACWAYAIGAHRSHAIDHEFSTALTLWAAMMIGMMLPVAAPMFVRYFEMTARTALRGRLVAAFALAYLSLWFAVSALGAWTQQTIVHAGLLSHAGRWSRPLIPAMLLTWRAGERRFAAYGG